MQGVGVHSGCNRSRNSSEQDLWSAPLWCTHISLSASFWKKLGLFGMGRREDERSRYTQACSGRGAGVLFRGISVARGASSLATDCGYIDDVFEGVLRLEQYSPLAALIPLRPQTGSPGQKCRNH